MTRTVGMAGGLAVVAALLFAPPAEPQPGNIWLRNGLRLRGQIQVLESEVVVSNEVGEVRLPRDEVQRVEFDVEPATRPTSEPAEPPPEPAGPANSTAAPPVAPPVGPEIPEPALLSALDIQRLKYYELRQDGAAEPVRVQVVGGRGRQELFRDVLQDLSQRPDFNARWREVLLNGTLEERVQLVAATSGAKYADRLRIMDDPEVFATFRSRVLPQIVKNCATSGCHAGASAAVFRLPQAARYDDAGAYTTFVLLDRLQTVHGPLIDRADPERSPLLGYMLPARDNPLAHPPLAGKHRYSPPLRSRESAVYEADLAWIHSLRTPHADYGLDYGAPAPAVADQERTEPAAPTSSPASGPAESGVGGE